MSVVRRATESELSAIARIDALEPFAWSVEQWRGGLEHRYGEVWVALDPSVIGAMVLLSLGDSWELQRLVVVQRRRREGVARRLLGGRLSASKMPWFLEVSENNPAAYRLYVALGFRRVGERPGYYRNGDTAWTMRWDPRLG
ncbi:MAG: GNAT family N-acetyltransferase [Myxococcota bacterium]